MPAKDTVATVITCLRYRDAPAAIELMTHPDQTSGRETQSAYVIVDDGDTTYASAKNNGAEIVMDIKDE